jgi:hypothetical protein
MTSLKLDYNQLLFILILLILSAPWLSESRIGELVFGFILLWTMVLSLRITHHKSLRSRIFRIFLMTGFILDMIYNSRLIPQFGAALLIARNSIYSVYASRAIWIISRIFFRAKRVNTNIILGALCVYLMAVVLWGMVYHMIDILDTHAFHYSFDRRDYPSFIYFYFSFTTITTAGYGDIVPVNRLAMVMANFESFFGLMFPAILIARLVSLYQQDEEE